MDRSCTNCGATIPERYRRCGACGTLQAGAGAPAEVRRFATVVNSDLKGSTALGERLDPETLREVLTLYFDEMRAVFESHGGTIEKIIGDAIVAVFGLPVRHDDDALRAVEAAAETQRALAILNDQLDETWGVRLVVRTGIATGDVVFGEATIGQHVLMGDTMVISSAMEQNAPPFEVLLAAVDVRPGRRSGERRGDGGRHAARPDGGCSRLPPRLGRGASGGPARALPTRRPPGCGCARPAARRTRTPSGTAACAAPC